MIRLNNTCCSLGVDRAFNSQMGMPFGKFESRYHSKHIPTLRNQPIAILLPMLASSPRRDRTSSQLAFKHPLVERFVGGFAAQRRRDARRRCYKASSMASDDGTLIKTTIKKPLGLVLEEGKDGGVLVAEVAVGGNAEKSGADVQVGDIVVGTSAVVLKKDAASGEYEREGYGQTPYTNWETIEFDCNGQTFDTVMAAIGSNNERWGIRTVTLTLLRKKSD